MGTSSEDYMSFSQHAYTMFYDYVRWYRKVVQIVNVTM